MARGNQRDKAREKAQKAAAGTVSNLAPLKKRTHKALEICRMEDSARAESGNESDASIENQEQHDRY